MQNKGTQRTYLGMTGVQVGILAALCVVGCLVLAVGAALLLGDAASPTPGAASVNLPMAEAPPAAAPTAAPTAAPDLARMALLLEDLPAGFEAVDLAEYGVSELLSQEGMAFEKGFAFVEAEQFSQLVMGFTGLLHDEYEQSDFDQQLAYPNYLLDSIVRGLGGASVVQRETLPGLEGIGDVATGLRIVIDDGQSARTRMDLVILRHEMVAALVMVIYDDGGTPVFPVDQAALKLDARIRVELGSTE